MVTLSQLMEAWKGWSPYGPRLAVIAYLDRTRKRHHKLWEQKFINKYKNRPNGKHKYGKKISIKARRRMRYT